MQTAEDLYDAITSDGGLRGVRVSLVDGSSVTPFNTGKLDGISTLNNFCYSEDGLTYWKAFDIGQGKTEKWSDMKG